MYYAHKQWIHGNINMVAARRAALVSFDTQRVLIPEHLKIKSARTKATQRQKPEYKIPYAFVSFAFVVGFALAFVYRWQTLHQMPQVLDYETVVADTLRLANRDDALARLNFQKKRQLAGEVHYVIGLIREHGGARVDNAAKELAQSIVFESKKANYDPLFVTAVIKSESTFRNQAISSVGAKGLMQIMPDTGKYISKNQGIQWVGAHRLHDPQYNLKLGIAYLKYLEKKFRGNKELMLVAYNWGPGNVQRAIKNRSHMPSSSLQYAKKIIGNHSRWKKEYSNVATNAPVTSYKKA